MMRRDWLVPTLALVVAACGSTSDGGFTTQTTNLPAGFASRTVVDNGVSYGFQVFVPANYNSVSKVPVILFLHGSGEKGSDNVSQTNVGLGPVVKATASVFPAIVVFPQGPAGENTRPTFIRIAQTALNQVLAEYSKADLTRIYLTGLSYGGIAAYDVAYFNPTKFAAFVPVSATVCGTCLTGSSTTTTAQGYALAAQTLKALPIWQFQGDQDTQVPVAGVRQLVATFQAVGSPIKYTEYKGAPHEIWDTVYGDANMYAWMYAQHR